eukprot:551004_1
MFDDVNIFKNVDKNRFNRTTNVIDTNKLPQYVQQTMTADLKLPQYSKDFEFQDLNNVDKKEPFQDLNNVDKKESENAPNFVRQATPIPKDLVRQATPIPKDLVRQATTEQKAAHLSEKQLKISFQVFDYDVDDDDKMMGSYEARIDTSNDTTEYHKCLQTVDLMNNELLDIDAGNISFRVFLNAIQIYMEHGMHYIDAKSWNE